MKLFDSYLERVAYLEKTNFDLKLGTKLLLFLQNPKGKSPAQIEILSKTEPGQKIMITQQLIDTMKNKIIEASKQPENKWIYQYLVSNDPESKKPFTPNDILFDEKTFPIGGNLSVYADKVEAVIKKNDTGPATITFFPNFVEKPKPGGT